jgi:hypothetical protein
MFCPVSTTAYPRKCFAHVITPSRRSGPCLPRVYAARMALTGARSASDPLAERATLINHTQDRATPSLLTLDQESPGSIPGEATRDPATDEAVAGFFSSARPSWEPQGKRAGRERPPPRGRGSVPGVLHVLHVRRGGRVYRPASCKPEASEDGATDGTAPTVVDGETVRDEGDRAADADAQCG